MSNDDIVTRLRSKYGGQLPICEEAADEIERLRNELKTAIKGRENWRAIAIQYGAEDWTDKKRL